MGSFRSTRRCITAGDEPINALFPNEEAWNRPSLFVTLVPLPTGSGARKRQRIEPSSSQAIQTPCALANQTKARKKFRWLTACGLWRFRRFQTDSALVYAGQTPTSVL